jgi:hypothetical protein
MINNLNKSGRVPMIRVDLTWVVNNLQGLNQLADLSHISKGGDAWLTLVIAKGSLTGLFVQSIYSGYFRVTRDKANKLFETLDNLAKRGENNSDFQLSEHELWDLNNQKSQFESVLFSEMALLPVYLATPKDAFDLEKLMESGDKLFPPTMLLKVPETQVDAMEAGKCLAFERNTACGFHTFRVVEAVLRKYWDAVAKGKPRPAPATLGTMSGQLEICKLGDDKVTNALKQMTTLHRNPISHPDVILTSDEACAILGMARSVITHMLQSLQEELPTTGVVLPSVSP